MLDYKINYKHFKHHFKFQNVYCNNKPVSMLSIKQKVVESFEREV